VKRIFKPANEMKTILENDPGSHNIFQPHFVLDIYPDRPDELESCSLYDFLGWFENKKLPGKESMQLKTLGLYLRHRKERPYIITHQTVNPNQSHDKKERYFYYLLKLSKPWRTEVDLFLPALNHHEDVLNREGQTDCQK